MKRRVVVTGMGIVSPLGNEVDIAYNNAINGVNGISLIDSFDTSELKVKIAGQIKDFDPKKHLSGRDVRRQDLYSQYAVNAAMDAFIDADLSGKYDPSKMGVILGTGMGGMGTLTRDLHKAFSEGYNKIPPMFIPMIIPNMASGNVSIALNAKAHTTTVTTACAAATNAIGDSFRLIRDGYADIMVTGGSEAAVNPYTLSGFAALTALSTNENPNEASRPFDKQRDGFVLAEGCGILILEELEHALARNAHIYAEMIGYGATSDAYHITAPSGIGATEAIRQAISD
ncbi:MAG: beta-ketoacyl synthase N-terminal-like domain-containing protein, partial [Erysipelotrichaceae bacterium]